jgi:hypothetical protein
MQQRIGKPISIISPLFYEFRINPLIVEFTQFVVFEYTLLKYKVAFSALYDFKINTAKESSICIPLISYFHMFGTESLMVSSLENRFEIIRITDWTFES